MLWYFFQDTAAYDPYTDQYMKYDHDPLYNPILPNVKIEQTDDHIEIGKLDL